MAERIESIHYSGANLVCTLTLPKGFAYLCDEQLDVQSDEAEKVYHLLNFICSIVLFIAEGKTFSCDWTI